jgi:hypothetical protein
MKKKQKIFLVVYGSHPRSRIDSDSDSGRDSGGGHKGSATREGLAGRFGVSSSTPDRVSTILDQGTPEQIQALRDKGETGEGLGVRTVYEQVQSEKLKSKLQRPTEGQAQQQQEVRRDNLKLINKDFRTVTRDEIPDGSADLVLVLDFPEPRIREDEGGRQFAPQPRLAPAGRGCAQVRQALQEDSKG